VATYRVIQGIDYKGRRAEPGDIVDDIPTKSIRWLTDQGIIEKVDGKAPEPVADVEEFDWVEEVIEDEGVE